MNAKLSPLFGTILDQSQMARINNPFLKIPGYFKGQTAPLCIDKDILSKHTMLIGGTGCGKTNVFYHFVEQIRKQLTTNDSMIVFDTKGDYFKKFPSSNNVVIGGGASFSDISAKWNIFREIVSDGWNTEDIEVNTQELSWSIFRDSIEKSKDPFFPNAARDLFASILQCMVEEAKDSVLGGPFCLRRTWIRRGLREQNG